MPAYIYFIPEFGIWGGAWVRLLIFALSSVITLFFVNDISAKQRVHIIFLLLGGSVLLITNSYIKEPIDSLRDFLVL